MFSLANHREWSRSTGSRAAQKKHRTPNSRWTRADAQALLLAGALLAFALVPLALRYWHFMPETFSLPL